MWSPDQIADALTDALQRHDAALREEQAVYGLDALDELQLHTIIAQGLITAGFGTLREQPYPHEWTRKQRPLTPSPHSSSPHSSSDLPLPIPRDRQRCDLVLTPKPSQTLSDSLTQEKTRRAEAKELEGTLFESLGTSHLAPGSLVCTSDIRHPTSDIAPELAYWLELKTLGQYTNTAGLPGPNRKYTTELTRNPLADLKKLTEDPRIHHAAAALILFTDTQPTARHDIEVLMHRARTKDLPITLSSLGGGHTRHFPIPDRIGNANCTVCFIALRKD